MRVQLTIIHISSEPYSTAIIVNVSSSFWDISHFRHTSIVNWYASNLQKIAIYTARITLPIGGFMVRRSTKVLRNYCRNLGGGERKCFMERWRHWETQRMQQDGIGAIWYYKEVVRGVAMSGDVAWLY
jgi:hypothetical protein